jgi:3-hydroxyacyl-CoA dehydrogenase
VAIATVAVVGAGLFGSSVHGLTQLDGRLADQRDRAAPTVRQEHRAVVRDCPWRDGRRL